MINRRRAQRAIHAVHPHRGGENALNSASCPHYSPTWIYGPRPCPKRASTTFPHPRPFGACHSRSLTLTVNAYLGVCRARVIQASYRVMAACRLRELLYVPAAHFLLPPGACTKSALQPRYAPALRYTAAGERRSSLLPLGAAAQLAR